MMKTIPCSRSKFGTQAEYEECLEGQRVKRGGHPAVDRLAEALGLLEDDDAEDDE